MPSRAITSALESGASAYQTIVWVDDDVVATSMATLTTERSMVEDTPILDFIGKVEAGGNCGSGDDCVDGLSCEFSNDDCFGTCGSDSFSCGGTTCAEGEYCNFGAPGGEACAPKLKEGDACTFSDDCTLEADDVECLPADGESSEGTCTKYGTVADGSYCDYDDDFCADGSSCDFETGLCASGGGASVTLATSGQPCDLENTPCAPGLVCTNLDFSTGGGTCGAPVGDGGECFIAFECEPSLTCVGVSFTSNPPTAGSCGPKLADGQACQSNIDCQSNNCDESGDDGVCAAVEVCVIP